MAFLDRLSKGVTKAASQAKFEADKVMRVNKLSSEANELARQVEHSAAEIGRKAIELITAGQIVAPELAEMVAGVQTLEASLATKRAELEEAKLAKFEEAPTMAVQPPAVGEQHCTNCGAELNPGAKFCPSCGQKTEA